MIDKPTTVDLHSLFEPAHVAVIGASRAPEKSGYRVAHNLIAGKFAGKISLTNPSGGELNGHRFLASIADAPGPVDCAIAIVPAEATIDVAKDCAKKGVRNLIIAATGFAELGDDEGRERQNEIIRIAQAAGMNIVGPNTNGLLNASCNLYLGYNTSHGEPAPPGPVSVVSHSGALMNHMIRRAHDYGVNISKFLPVGNEAGVNMLDALDYYIDDPDTRVIGMIIEGLSDGQRFRLLAGRAHAAGKPIIALKLGRSQAGAESSLAHSSRLAGNARAYDALFRSARVGSVPSIEALAGACALIAKRQSAEAITDERLICISSSGAGASMLADYAEMSGMTLAGGAGGAWQGETAKQLAAVPTPAPIRNPIDTGSVGPPSRLRDLFDILVDTGHTGPGIFFTHFFQVPGAIEARAKAFIHYRARTGAPCAVVTPGGLGEEFEALYRSRDIVVFRDIATCFDAMGAHYGTLAPPRDPIVDAHAVQHSHIEQALADAIAQSHGSGMIDEYKSASVLRAAGINVVKNSVVESLQDALEAAEKIGFPLVLKALAPNVAHKAKLGLVHARIADAAGIKLAFSDISTNLRLHGIDPSQTKILVQPMVRGKLEIILGASREPGLGHFLLVGLGGVYTEIFDEVMLFAIPFNIATFADNLAQSKIGRLIAAAGGEDDLSQITRMADQLQSLILTSNGQIEAIDVNPILINEGDPIAVDALITCAS